ncbi:MAG: threonine--tRNA ligase [archaeon]
MAKTEIAKFETPEEKRHFWHSSSHLLAEAVTGIWPDALPTIGPAIDGGFYYDFDKKEPFTPQDLEKIEKKMREIAERGEKIARKEVSAEEARKLFAKNPYKLELINEFAEKGEKITLYYQGKFFDLCEGGHADSLGQIRAIKLLKVAGAYWRGSEKNKMLQRIYGISFPKKEMLEDYLKMIEEAEKRDHKRIGKEMDLFMQSELVGKGLPIWLPKGEIIRQEIEELAMRMEKKAGYVRVRTPHLAKKELYLMSGHLPHYAETMYPEMKLDDGSYYLKAMNCPHHHLIYNHRQRSYRELPLRIAEYGTCYRNELSGTLTGLLRVRMLSMNDAHIYCTFDQIESEFESVIKMIVDYYKVFGFGDYYFRLSLHDPQNREKYIDDPKGWSLTEGILRNVLERLKVKFVEAKGEASFYGPKVDIQFKMVTGREETMSTVQLDFAAKKKFGLSYADRDGKENGEVYVIHRAPLSTHERLIAFLIEHYAGNFPMWLNPVQAIVFAVSEKFSDYAKKVQDALIEAGIRSEFDDSDNTLPYKVRRAQLERTNYAVTVGGREEEAGTVTARDRKGKLETMKLEEFVSRLAEEARKP